MSTFSFNPDHQAKKSVKPKVSNIKFGDGYEQRVTFGLNSINREWSLTFANRLKAEADDIEGFLEARGGVQSFDWTPPGQDSAIKVKCQVWDRTIVKGNRFTITAKFEQVFDP